MDTAGYVKVTVRGDVYPQYYTDLRPGGGAGAVIKDGAEFWVHAGTLGVVEGHVTVYAEPGGPEAYRLPADALKRTSM